MNLNVPTERYTVPTAFVTKGRQRVKQYDNTTVYLNNGEEFEIELFNPTSDKVMAKIDLNGVSIGPGVVLRPGERVFLERYLNEAKKFLFETYEVDGNDPNVQGAIAQNGSVSVKFYNEEIPFVPYVSPTVWTYTSWPTYTPFGGIYHSTGGTVYGTITGQGFGQSAPTSFSSTKGRKMGKSVSNDQKFMLYSASIGSERCFDYSDGNTDMTAFAGGASMEAEKIETGRIEKGDNSNQSFGYDHSKFNVFWSWKTEWKILPMSQKPRTREDLVVYCPNCQAKRRKESHRFCPICGTQY